MIFLSELSAHLATFRASLRGRRQHGDQLQVEVAQDIVADAAAQQGRVGQLAYTAEQADLEAGQLLDQVLADKRVTPDEIPLLQRAARNVRRSAATDRKITEALA